MSQPYLQTQALTKDFGRGRGAFDISITINPGEIVGFIGPNGAGKTTTIRMLIQLLRQDKGTLQLFNTEITDNDALRNVISRIGFMSGEPSFYPTMSSLQLFEYVSEIYGKNYTHNAKELAEELSLDTKTPFKYLSLGNRKKVGFIQALMHHPDLIILDEPTSGLDPLIQQKVLNTLKQARTEGKTVFLSSHVLSEVQQICDRIIMIKDGRIILQDSTSNILAKAVKTFRMDNMPANLLQEVKKLSVVRNTEEAGKETIVYATDTKPVIELLVKHNRYDFYLERSSLEDMFLEEYK